MLKDLAQLAAGLCHIYHSISGDPYGFRRNLFSALKLKDSAARFQG